MALSRQNHCVQLRRFKGVFTFAIILDALPHFYIFTKSLILENRRDLIKAGLLVIITVHLKVTGLCVENVQNVFNLHVKWSIWLFANVRTATVFVDRRFNMYEGFRLLIDIFLFWCICLRAEITSIQAQSGKTLLLEKL